MNDAHDMGGVLGFGAVETESDEPVFHADWERRVFALTRAMGATGEWNLDEVRFAREDRRAGRVPRDELLRALARRARTAAGRAWTRRPRRGGGRPLAPNRTSCAAGSRDGGGRHARPRQPKAAATARARFAPGDRVRADNIHPPGHTRLPRYVRGQSDRVCWFTESMSFPTRTPMDAARTHSGSTPFASTGLSCGAPRPTRA